MKPIKILTVIAIVVNIILLSVYQQQFGVKIISCMIVLSTVAGFLLYTEAKKIKRSWCEQERRLLIRKVAEISLAALMTCFAGILLVTVLVHRFI